MSTPTQPSPEFTLGLPDRKVSIRLPRLPNESRVLFHTGGAESSLAEPKVIVPQSPSGVGYCGSMMVFDWPGTERERMVASLPDTIESGYAIPRLLAPLQKIALKTAHRFGVGKVLHGEANVPIDALTYRFTVAESVRDGGPKTLSLLMGHETRPPKDLGPVARQGPTWRGGVVFAQICGLLFLTPNRSFVQLQLQTTFFKVDGIIEVRSAEHLRMPDFRALAAASGGVTDQVVTYLQDAVVLD